ncbi:MAG: serine/threonine-protein kinase, partial [Verrucomicrobiota bacterium]
MKVPSEPYSCPKCGRAFPDDLPYGICACQLIEEVAETDPSQGKSVRQIGPYRIISTLGEGGFGIVYVARQEWPFRREVALKILKPGIDSAQVSARFQSESETLARLDHPNIASIFDAGESPDGLPYFVMEKVSGSDIRKYCELKGLSIEERLQLFIAVCNGVHHAHQKGIIHRDIKPSNIVVQSSEGSPLPKVIDFGIAKALGTGFGERTVALTQAHQIIGTLSYMSPEQAGGSNDIDIRADIYSLGVVLYELLTGTPPFGRGQLRNRSYEEVLRLISEVTPPLPSARAGKRRNKGQRVPSTTSQRTVERALRGDLDSIVMRALEKDRVHRYETVQALIEDIGRHQQNEPVLASRAGRVYRVRKFVTKHKRLVSAAALVLFSLVTAFGTSAYLYSEAVAAGKRESDIKDDVEAH